MQRKDKQNYYLDIAQTVSERGTCLFVESGAIIVKNDIIIATGYKGPPRGRRNCIDTNICMCQTSQIDGCRSVHAEVNCIISASYSDMIGSTMYVCNVDKETNSIKAIECCSNCKKLIINSGIDKVVIRVTPTEYKEIIVRDWVFNDDSIKQELIYK